MTKLLTQNKKIKGSSGDNYTVFNFGIPAYRSKNGDITCPMAGECAKAAGCYALQGAYTWSNVAQAYESRLRTTFLPADEFVEAVAAELGPKLKTAGRQGKQVVIRIHDSGDFYDLTYLSKWRHVMERFPEVLFYAYTKMVPLFKRLRNLPDNFTVIYSEGGKADSMIDTERDRHSRVFSTHAELYAAGYADATENDLVAALGDNPKIGLVYHGAKSKAWATNGDAA